MSDELAAASAKPGDWLVTAEQALVMLPALKPMTLRVWTFRGRLTSAEQTPQGRALYWLSDIDALMRGDVPTKTPQTPRPGVVYYARMRDGLIKIGYTADLYTRIRALRIRQDAVLATEPGGRDLEILRHAQFGAIRHGKTEDFDAVDELLGHVAAVRDEYGPPVITPRRAISA
ncbi:hypothetical protein [Cellulomonas rhizosphaerae]|nr:hypothetical protein [Cellulomonas rhizosphaerae]